MNSELPEDGRFSIWRPRVKTGVGLPAGTRSALAVTMKTPGEIEAATCEGIRRCEPEYRGLGPEDIHACLPGDFVVGRLQGLSHRAGTQDVQPGETSTARTEISS
jgi:hypothetical protein